MRIAARSAAALVVAGAIIARRHRAAGRRPAGHRLGPRDLRCRHPRARSSSSGSTLAGALDLPLLAVFDLLSIGLVAVLVERTGESSSAYAALYLFAVVHAAAFQPRRWLILVMAAAVAAFLAPLVYDDTIDDRFEDIAIAAIASAIVGAALIHLTVSALRAQRARSFERETEALRLAEQDALTGLGNYRMFARALEAEGARARRYGDPFSLVVLDLNGFKAINDELGHSVGDHALRVVADGLRSALRAEDVLCRQGGDEFAVIAVRAGPVEGRDLAVRLVDAVAEASAERELPRPVTASAGWATFGRHAQTTDALIACADEALRRVKRNNGGPQVGDPAEPEDAGEAALGDGVPTADLAALTTLSSLARALTVAETPREIASVTVAHLAGAIDASEARVLRWNREGQSLEVIGYGGPGAREVSAASIPDDSGLLSVVVRERRSVIVADGRPESLVRDEDSGSELAVPVLVGDSVWGVLHASSDRTDAYAAQDLQPRRGDGRSRSAARSRARGSSTASPSARALRPPGSPTRWRRPGRPPTRSPTWRSAWAASSGSTRASSTDLRAGALFHDIGTLAVPLGVLHKPGRLTEHERAVVRDHVVFGERLLGRVPEMRGAARLVRHAHERVDGTGYPDGLAGTEIPLGSRILLACDAYVAMTSARPYRAALTTEQATERAAPRRGLAARRRRRRGPARRPRGPGADRARRA